MECFLSTFLLLWLILKGPFNVAFLAVFWVLLGILALRYRSWTILPITKQDSIPVGWVPFACQPYERQWPTDVSTSGRLSSEVQWTSFNRSQWWPPDVTSGGKGSPCPKSGGELDGMTGRQTDTTENITFPQLRLRVVNTHTFISSPYVLCSVDNQFSMWTTQFN